MNFFILHYGRGPDSCISLCDVNRVTGQQICCSISLLKLHKILSFKIPILCLYRTIYFGDPLLRVKRKLNEMIGRMISCFKIIVLISVFILAVDSSIEFSGLFLSLKRKGKKF